MNIIENLKDLLEQSPFIPSVNIDFSENTIGNFGLKSTGESLIKTSVTGKKTYAHNFVLYFYSNSKDDTLRINNTNLLKGLAEYLSNVWYEDITEPVLIGTIPMLTVWGHNVYGPEGTDITLGYIDSSGDIVEPEQATKLVVRSNTGPFYLNGILVEFKNGKATMIMSLPTDNPEPEPDTPTAELVYENKKVGVIESIICSNAMVFDVPVSQNDGYKYQMQIKLTYHILP